MGKEKKIWDDILSERDKKVYEMGGFGKQMELGRRPAILIIDVTYEFVGEKPEPILESIKNFPLSSGEEGWKAVKNLNVLLDYARKKNTPVLYSAPEFRPETGKTGATKTPKNKEDFSTTIPDIKKIVREICPKDEDVVIYKQRASAFFGTPLISYLTKNSVDTLLVGGGTTSGCVRASVVDAFSYGLKIAVIEECTFDRGEVSHKINLFDIHQKYANVIHLDEALEYLKKI